MKSGNLNFLEPSGPLLACNGTALPSLCTVVIHSMSWHSTYFPVPTVIPAVQVRSFRLLHFPYYMSCSKNNNNIYFIISCYLKITTADLCPCIIISKQHVVTFPRLNYKLKHILKNTSKTDKISTNNFRFNDAWLTNTGSVKN